MGNVTAKEKLEFLRVIKNFAKLEEESEKEQREFYVKHEKIIKKAMNYIPLSIKEEVLEKFYFALLKQGVIPKVSSDKEFKVLVFVSQKILPYIERGEIQELSAYHVTFFFGLKEEKNLELYLLLQEFYAQVFNRSPQQFFSSDYWELGEYADKEAFLSLTEKILLDAIERKGHPKELLMLEMLYVLAINNPSLEIQCFIVEEKLDYVLDKIEMAKKMAKLHGVIEAENFLRHLFTPKLLEFNNSVDVKILLEYLSQKTPVSRKECYLSFPTEWNNHTIEELNSHISLRFQSEEEITLREINSLKYFFENESLIYEKIIKNLKVKWISVVEALLDDKSISEYALNEKRANDEFLKKHIKLIGIEVLENSKFKDYACIELDFALSWEDEGLRCLYYNDGLSRFYGGGEFLECNKGVFR